MEEAIYYIHINGRQRGPFTLNQLLSEGLTPETMVWRNGMPNWGKASTIPELQILFASPQSAVQPATPHYSPYENQQTGYNRFPAYSSGWTNWMGWAVTGTIIGGLTCCLGLIFGIIGMVKSTQANQQAHYGDYMQAQETNSSARSWTIASLVIGGIFLLWIIIMIIGGIFEVSALLNTIGNIYNN